MRVCDRHGWTLEQFRALSLCEQDRWLDWEEARLKRIQKTIKRITEGDQVYAETVTAHAILAMLWNE
jgi:hypothetical protein